MNVLVVSNMYPSQKNPNYGIFVRNFVEDIKDRGANISLICLLKEKKPFLKILNYIWFYCKIIICCLFKKYDVVYVHYASHSAIPLILSRKIKKFKLYVNVHGTDVLPIQKKQEKFQKYVYILLNMADKVITPTNYYKAVVMKKYEIEEERIYISPSGGVNKRLFYPINNRKDSINKINLNPNNFYIGYVGRIDEGKGWEDYLYALDRIINEKKITDITALMIGSGAQLSNFKDKIKELKLENFIYHIPTLPQQNLNEYYNMMDIFCFPSHQESLGLVGVEALMCGIPIVGSNIPAISEYVREETGILFEPGNFIDLCNKLLFMKNNLQDNQKLKIQYKQKCIEMANKYESNSVANQLYQVLISN